MALLALFVFNMTLVFIGFFLSTYLDRMFGLGTVNRLMLISVVLAIAALFWKACHKKGE